MGQGGQFAEKYFKVAEMMLDDRCEDGLLELFVAVNSDVTKSDHVFHGGCRFFTDQGVLKEQFEGISAALWDAEATLGDVVHREVDGGFAGTEKIEDDGILNGKIAESSEVTL